MTTQQIEYAIIAGSTAKVIVKKCNAKLADVKFSALQLKREGVITEEAAQKYFNVADVKIDTIAAPVSAPEPVISETPVKAPTKAKPKTKAKAKAKAPAEKNATGTPRRRRRPATA